VTAYSARRVGRPRAYSDAELKRFKQQVLEMLPQGWTLRQIFAQPGMCNLAYLFTDLLPKDELFAKQYARAFELRNEYWAEEMVEIAQDSRNDWMTRTYGDTEVDVPNPEVTKRS
jgi:hypothetical protein